MDGGQSGRNRTWLGEETADRWKGGKRVAVDCSVYKGSRGLFEATLARDYGAGYNLGNEDIHVGMRFPSGIAAGPVPAEPSADPTARRRRRRRF